MSQTFLEIKIGRPHFLDVQIQNLFVRLDVRISVEAGLKPDPFFG